MQVMLGRPAASAPSADCYTCKGGGPYREQMQLAPFFLGGGGYVRVIASGFVVMQTELTATSEPAACSDWCSQICFASSHVR